MRLFVTIILLALFISGEGQSGMVKKISLGEAITMARMNSTSPNSGDQKTLVAEVEETYFDMVFQLSSYKILQEKAWLYRDVERVANLRYQVGDIDLLEKTKMISGVYEIKNALSMLNEDLSVSANKMKFLLLTKDDVVPLDTVLQMYAVQKGEDLPSQLDSSAQRKFDNKKETLEFELNKSFGNIQHFQQVALGRAEMLMNINRIRFEKEDIDYIEYTQEVEEAFQIQLEYLQILNKYDQTAIQLELYAY